MKAKLIIIIIACWFANIALVSAQCPMCKSNVEQSRKAGSNAAKGLNNGILYLLAMPYLAVGGIGLWWYHKQKSIKQR
ncbi:MAG: hypothetical protein NZ108_00785 [Bacteroidia bacterium]|nr:hypothetical protein [Bacteroidia bacterium]